MAKTKLITRILNAYRALRGDPWPAQIVVSYPPKIERHNIQTFKSEHVTGRDFDEWAPETIGEIIQKEMVAELCEALLQAGAIEMTTEPADLRKYDPFAGTVYSARVRVVMPKEEDKEDGQE